MQRWHSEVGLMTRRWRQELASHGDGHPTSATEWSFPWMALGPPSLAPQIECHCALGIGSMRKKRLHDCGNTRCGLCHFDKFHMPKNRANKRREAIRFDIEANLE